MNRIVYSFLILLFLAVGCSSKEEVALASRWNFAGTDAKDLRQIASEYSAAYGINGFKQVFAFNKFILRKDGTFDLCLFSSYRHGKWKEENGHLILLPQPQNHPVSFIIDSLSTYRMVMSIDSSNFNRLGRIVMPYYHASLFRRNQYVRFSFEKDEDNYKNLSKDPYSVKSNQWRIAPLQAESDQQLRDRLLNLVDFHILMFKDAINNNRKVITYNWFSSPLIVAKNGIALENYNKIKDDWQGYFYDSTQAVKAFNMLRAAFRKPMRFKKDIADPFQKSIYMLDLYRKNLG